MKQTMLVLVTASAFFFYTPQAHAAPSGQPVSDQTAPLFRLPEQIFAPAMLDPGFDRVESNALANQSDFKVNHGQSYDALGRTTGYFQRASWGDVRLSYMASVYVTPFDAANAFREGLEASGKNNSHAPEGCGYVVHHSCARLSWNCSATAAGPPKACTTADGTTADGTGGVYWVDQYNQCVVEVKAEAYAGITYTSQDSISPTSQAMLQTADHLLTQLCPRAPISAAPEMDYSVVTARVERRGAAADFRLQSRALRSVSTGTTVSLAIYFSVTRTPPQGCKTLASFWVKQNGAVVFTHQSRTITVGPTPGTYRLLVNYTPLHAGKFSIVGQVNMQGWNQQYLTGITVVGRK